MPWAILRSFLASHLGIVHLRHGPRMSGRRGHTSPAICARRCGCNGGGNIISTLVVSG